MKTLIASVLFLFLAGCSGVKDLTDAGSTAIDIFGQLTAKDTTVIHFNPVYFQILPDTITEREYLKDGYRIWTLKSNSTLRVEIQKLDTIIINKGK